MVARAIASGRISFGLVSVPVKLYSATRSKSVSFNLLHEKDKSRLRQQYVCNACNEVVTRDEMVKGYEYARNQFVVITEADLKALETVSDQSIEIEEFVPLHDVDPVYFNKAYLLGPDKGGSKPFQLLCEAMEKAKRAAVAKYSTLGRTELVLLRQTGGGLMMHTLFYADEVTSMEEVERGAPITPKENELDLAVELIQKLGSDSFAPEKYEDAYRKKVIELIERKVAGQEITAPSPEAPKAQIIDLMEALKASLAAKDKLEAKVMAERKPARAKGKAGAGAKRASK